MQLLAFTDLHGDFQILKRICKRAAKDDIDLIVTPGDLTVFNNHLGIIMKRLQSIGKPVLLIPGNHESMRSIDKHIHKYHNLINIHKKIVEIKGVTFFGYGLGGFSSTDKELRKLAESWKPKLKDKKSIFLVHGPPYKSQFDTVGGSHVGNQDINYAIELLQPTVMFCGHIHENNGKSQKIGKTMCINPGWDGMVIEVQ